MGDELTTLETSQNIYDLMPLLICMSVHITCRWFGDWEAYAGYPPLGQDVIRADNSSRERPGTIDNTDILDTAAEDKLLPDLREGRDFKLLSEDAWKYLHDLYGGGPVITRRVVNAKGRPVVEIYYMNLQIKRSSDPSKTVTISVSQEVMPLPINFHGDSLVAA